MFAALFNKCVRVLSSECGSVLYIDYANGIKVVSNKFECNWNCAILFLLLLISSKCPSKLNRQLYRFVVYVITYCCISLTCKSFQSQHMTKMCLCSVCLSAVKRKLNHMCFQRLYVLHYIRIYHVLFLAHVCISLSIKKTKKKKKKPKFSEYTK